jgi:arylsulfatase
VRRALAGVAAAAALLAGCGRGDPRPSVLLLTVDTLRPDYLSSNGYDRPTSPAIDALLAQGFVFEEALAPVPHTTPALASLLTGAYPHRTGVRSLTDRLRADAVSIAEILGTAGWQTVAVVSNHVLARSRGLDRGFEQYDVGHQARTATATTRTAQQMLASLDRKRPVFAWVHYIDPHVPYHPPAELAESFDPGYDGPYPLNFGYQPRDGEPTTRFQPFPPELPKRVASHRNPLPASVNEHIRRLYAAEVRAADDGVAELLATARRLLGENLIVIFTADHGESLGENDFYFDHGDYVYNAAARVPLAFVLPPGHPLRGSGRCSGWVSLVDVVPTLVELIGLRAEKLFLEQIEGRSLASCMRGEPLPEAPVFVESGTSFAPELVRRLVRNDVSGRFRAAVLGDWKLVFTPFRPDAEAFELYDVARDPFEAHDLYRPDHPELPRLRRALTAWLGRAPEGGTAPAPDLGERDREALRSLGYLDSP